MKDETTDRLIAKVKKLLALAQSDNFHEAAAALSRARDLMERHGLSDADVELAGIAAIDSRFKCGAVVKPPSYFIMLANTVAINFGVENIFMSGEGRIKFVGPAARAVIAGYAHHVLGRQLAAARVAFLSGRNAKRWKRTMRIARADRFCEGWCFGVHELIRALVPSDRERELTRLKIEAMGPTSTRSGRSATKTDRLAQDACAAGWRAGQKARLHAPVAGEDAPLLLSSG